MALIALLAIIALGAWLTYKRKKKVETPLPPDEYEPQLPEDYDGSKGWFGRK